jgi:ferredoxin-type protein NapH
MFKRSLLILGLFVTVLGIGSLTEEIHGCFAVPVAGALYYIGLTSGEVFGFLERIAWYLIAVGGLIVAMGLLFTPNALKRWSRLHLSTKKMATWRSRRTIAHTIVFALITLHITLTVLGLTSFKGVCPRTLGEYIMKGQLGAAAFFWALMLIMVLVWGRTLCGWLCVYAPVQEQAANLLRLLGADPRRKSRPFKRTTLVYVTTTLLWSSYLYHLVRNYRHLDVNMVHGGTVNSYWVFYVGAVTMLPLTMFAVYYLGSRWFCKYLCPIGGFLGLYSKYGLLQVKIERSKCRDCGLCSRNCQMSIDIEAHIKHQHENIADHECIGCGDCIDSCPQHALSFGIRRLGRREALELPAVSNGKMIDGIEAGTPDIGVFLVKGSSKKCTGEVSVGCHVKSRDRVGQDTHSGVVEKPHSEAYGNTSRFTPSNGTQTDSGVCRQRRRRVTLSSESKGNRSTPSGTKTIHRTVH